MADLSPCATRAMSTVSQLACNALASRAGDAARTGAWDGSLMAFARCSAPSATETFFPHLARILFLLPAASDGHRGCRDHAWTRLHIDVQLPLRVDGRHKNALCLRTGLRDLHNAA